MQMEWCCPFCDRDQIVTEKNMDGFTNRLEVGKSVHGDVGVIAYAIRCSNPKCNEVELTVKFSEIKWHHGRQVYDETKTIDLFNLRPASHAKPQPDYIPAPLREDYYEACSIVDKSPKASATLARRCLQGMIRDFCKIKKGTLIAEIVELREMIAAGTAPKGVDAETIEAIDAVRSIGNIGAHMEKDINIIVDVDPGEAQALLQLIEMLFKDWYVAKNQRQLRLQKIEAIAAEKKDQRAGNGSEIKPHVE